MTLRERIMGLGAALFIAGLGGRLLDAPAPDPVARTPLTWCLPEESPAQRWARDRWKPAHAVRVIMVARDAVTGRRLQATLSARPLDGTFAQVTGGVEPGYWDLPAGMEMVFSASTARHYSGSGVRRVPAVPGGALAVTAQLLPRAAPLLGTVKPGDDVRLERPEPAPEEWGFVDRLRASPLASTGLDEVWSQSFGAAVTVQPDGNWSHSCVPGLPLAVIHVERAAARRTLHGMQLTPIQDLNRADPPRDRTWDRTASAAIAMPPYPTQWPPARVSLRAVTQRGRPVAVTVRARRASDAAGAAGREVAAGRGSLEFELEARVDWLLDVQAAGHHPHTLEVRLEPLDRLWIPALELERTE